MGVPFTSPPECGPSAGPMTPTQPTCPECIAALVERFPQCSSRSLGGSATFGMSTTRACLVDRSELWDTEIP